MDLNSCGRRADKPKPWRGYLFRIVPKDWEGRILGDAAHRDADRFSFCAVPADPPKSGQRTLLIKESRFLFGKDNGGKAVEIWPEAGISNKEWKPFE